MNLVVNGRPRDVDEGATVQDLIEALGLGPRWVVVERNGEPVPRSRFAEEHLRPGDVLEVVRPVQGGAVELGPLYLVCDGRFPVDILEAVIEAGVSVVQLREKELEAVEIIEAAGGMQEVCRRRGIPFVLNDRPDIAGALRADGVHLGQDDLPPRFARDILGPEVIVGRSTHGPSQIDAAVADHEAGLVDYIAVGPVYETPTKPGRPAVGLDLVRYAADRVAFPWFAIGGIGVPNVPDVVEAGARRIVVVRAITEARDPVAAAADLAEALW